MRIVLVNRQGWLNRGGFGFGFESFIQAFFELSLDLLLNHDSFELAHNLCFDTEQDSLHRRLLLLAFHFVEVVLDQSFELSFVFLAQQLLPVVLFPRLSVFIFALIVRLDHVSPLILQEEPLCRGVEHLLVHSVHLLTFYQSDNVKVASQLFLAPFQGLDAPLGLGETLGAPLFAATEEATKRLYEPVDPRELKLLAIHD